ncbi:hypothetical protein BaRGS_00026190 [Batillaria attramentaria]|uniref:TIR domain-containing protein n=1 Tax=Batillaria attramentaria TaxID=370345 RepID=A0ABD0K5P5_9CAEN
MRSGPLYRLRSEAGTGRQARATLEISWRETKEDKAKGWQTMLQIQAKMSAHTTVLLVLLHLTPTPVHLTSWPCLDSCKCDTDSVHPHGLVVNCRGQNLHQVPPSIPSNTTTLLLTRNNLTRLPDSTFSRLAHLLTLDLAFNYIHTIEENAFVGLGRLIALNLTGNHLRLSPATYPAGVYRPLTSLQVLRLENNARKRSQSHQSVASAQSPSRRSVAQFSSESGSLGNDRLETDIHSAVVPPTLPSSDDQGEAPSPELRSGASIHDQVSQPDASEMQLDYPDEALSHLPSLRELYMDGLENRTLGPGFRNLTKLTFLDLSGNKGNCFLGDMSPETLVNAPYLQHVNISKCRITNLTADTFGELQDLRVLDLSFNFALGFDRLGDAFEGLAKTKLEILEINSVVSSWDLGTQITAYHLRYFKDLRYLWRLSARFNRIVSFEEGALCNGTPPNLTHAYLDANLLQLAPYLNDLICLEKLEVLHINGYNSYWTPQLRAPFLSNPQDRPDSGSVCVSAGAGTRGAESLETEYREFVFPPKLRIFKARHFGLFYKLMSIPVNPNNSLERLVVGENHFRIWKGPVTGLENLKELELSNSFGNAIFPQFLSSFPFLEVLDISGNRLRRVFRYFNEDGAILGGLRKLKVLNMSRNDLGDLDNSTFINLTNLELLSLKVNAMGSFVHDISHMKNLVHLDLADNQLHTLPKSVRDHLDSLAEIRHITVNMTLNPIGCTCQNIDFLKWVRDTRVDFGTHKDYYCQMEDGSKMMMADIWITINQLDRTCGSYVGVFVGAVASSLLFVVLLVVALVYRFRWKLRYLYYATRLSFQRNKRHLDDGFKFDAFVSFAGEDMEFVDGELKEELEEGRGLKLCIHERDFVPGQYIASNIVDSVQRSRRTLVVLTRALLASDWCHYELQMALMEAAETGRDVLLFLLYEQVPSHELPREVLFNIQAASYIEFPHTESDRGLFWDRLADALRR